MRTAGVLRENRALRERVAQLEGALQAADARRAALEAEAEDKSALLGRLDELEALLLAAKQVLYLHRAGASVLLAHFIPAQDRYSLEERIQVAEERARAQEEQRRGAEGVVEAWRAFAAAEGLVLPPPVPPPPAQRARSMDSSVSSLHSDSDYSGGA